jgi:hypothetical protein
VGRLINQFIAGLAHPEAHRQLRMEQAANRLPTDYKGILVQASNIVSQCQLIQQDAQRRAAGGQWDKNSLQQQPPALSWPKPPEPPFPAPVPMEIGAVSYQPQWCAFHWTRTHNTNDCVARKMQMPRRPPGSGNGPRPTGNSSRFQMPPSTNRFSTRSWTPRRGNNQTPTVPECWTCGEPGHRRTECPGPRRDQRRPIPPTPVHRTQTVEEVAPDQNAADPSAWEN